jgi:threonine/homoserine/homoserine lactone efflux protein
VPESTLTLFLISSLIVIAAPGQDLVLVVSRSIALGAKAGVITAAGVSVGLIGHTVLAAMGLGTILLASESIFTAMKIVGAAYLIYLGVKTFRAPPIDLTQTNEAQGNLRTLFYQGAISNLSNPKIAIFYFAFLPQFVTLDSSNPTQTIFALGVAFAILTFLVKVPIGFVAGAFSGWLKDRPNVQIWFNRASGGVLMALGLRLAFDTQPEA